MASGLFFLCAPRIGPQQATPCPRTALTAPSNVNDEAPVDDSAASELLGGCHRVNGLLAFQWVADFGTGAQAWSAHQAKERAERERGQGTWDLTHTRQTARSSRSQEIGLTPFTLRLGVLTTAPLTFRAGEFSAVGGLSCTLRGLSSIPGFHPLIARGT